MTPIVQTGYPTIWAWITPSPDLIAVPVEEALALLEQTNGPVQ